MKFKWIIQWKGFEIPVLGIIIFQVVFIWSLGLVIAPLTLPANSVPDFTPDMTKVRWGVGIMDNTEITKDMNPYAKYYYESGDYNCHTIKERSFFINGNQMPFCARDVAIFFGMALGMGIVLFIRFEVKLWWVIGGLIPIGLDGGLQLITPYESNNLFRVLTGGLTGIVTMLALGYVIYDISKDAEIKKRFKETASQNPEYPKEPYENVNQNSEMKDDKIPSPEAKINPIQDESKAQPEEEIK